MTGVQTCALPICCAFYCYILLCWTTHHRMPCKADPNATPMLPIFWNSGTTPFPQSRATAPGTTAGQRLGVHGPPAHWPPRPSASQHGTRHPVASAPGEHGPLGAGLRWFPEQWRGSVGKASHQNSKKSVAWAWHSGQPCRACDGGWSSTSKFNNKRCNSIRAATTPPKHRPAWH